MLLGNIDHKIKIMQWDKDDINKDVKICTWRKCDTRK